MKLLMHFSQDDVIKLLDVIPPADVNNFQDVFLVMSCCESNLQTLINSETILTDTHVNFITYQIFRGLRYIHSGNIVHRDIVSCFWEGTSAIFGKIKDLRSKFPIEKKRSQQLKSYFSDIFLRHLEVAEAIFVMKTRPQDAA